MSRWLSPYRKPCLSATAPPRDASISAGTGRYLTVFRRLRQAPGAPAPSVYVRASRSPSRPRHLFPTMPSVLAPGRTLPSPSMESSVAARWPRTTRLRHRPPWRAAAERLIHGLSSPTLHASWRRRPAFPSTRSYPTARMPPSSFSFRWPDEPATVSPRAAPGV